MFRRDSATPWVVGHGPALTDGAQGQSAVQRMGVRAVGFRDNEMRRRTRIPGPAERPPGREAHAAPYRRPKMRRGGHLEKASDRRFSESIETEEALDCYRGRIHAGDHRFQDGVLGFGDACRGKRDRRCGIILGLVGSVGELLGFAPRLPLIDLIDEDFF